MVYDTSADKMTDLQKYEAIQKAGCFDIEPCERDYDFDDANRFTKLKLNESRSTQINAIMQQIPTVLAADSLAKAYTVKFPEGLPHTLTALKQGGYGTMIKGETGEFVGSASMFQLSSQAAMLSAFSAMSIATGQYFLKQINNELSIINQKIDKILDFLYGDKKAELMAEMSFVKYAYQNYMSIMEHEQQRVATIGSLQEAKKVAVKDIEFYMGNLSSAVGEDTKSYAEISKLVTEAFNIKNSLDASMQLYIMSNLMEIYFSQNYDREYINALDAEISFYIDKSEKRMLSSFSVLNHKISDYKGKALEKFNKEDDLVRTDKIINSLDSGEESDIRKFLRSSLYAPLEKSQYYLQAGNIYVDAR